VLRPRRFDPTTSTTTTATPTTTTTTTATPSPTSTKGLSEDFAFGETAYVTNQGAPAAEITIEPPAEFVATNPYTTPKHGRFVYVRVTFKVTDSQPIPVQSNDFEIDLPNGAIEFHLYVSSLLKDVPADIDERTVQPGETLVGSVVFDVPKDQPMKVAYAPVLKDLAHRA
jgi:hypothetical protein